MFGGKFLAIIIASIKKVPDPHIGSKNEVSLFHFVSKIIPAASTSFIGAIDTDFL